MTVRLVTTNLDFATGPEKDQDHLQHLVNRFYKRRPKTVTAVILGAQEARNFRLGLVLRTVGKLLQLLHLAPQPQVVQGQGLAKAGTAIAAFGAKLHNPRLILSGTSRFTMPRWLTRAAVDVKGGRLEVNVVHIVPPRAGEAAQDKQLRKVRSVCSRAEKRGHGWSVLGDFNTSLADVARVLGGVAYGTPRGIGIVVSKRVKVGDAGPDTYGVRHHETDHPAWYVDVEGLVP